MAKLNNVRNKSEKIQVLDKQLDEVAIGAQEYPSRTSKGQYLTIRYWYANDLRVDKSKYTKVNDELWSYFMNASDGSLFLKYEMDYFTYKVVYTAREIRPNRFEETKNKAGVAISDY